MKKGWRIILGIVLVALVMGGLCFGLGLLTGADTQRIIQNVDEHYRLTAYVQAYTDYFKQLVQYFAGLF